MKYLRPVTLKDYHAQIQALPPESISILSGGTDLAPRLQNGSPLPEYLIDIKKIKELHGISDRDDNVIIGANTPIETLKRSAIIQTRFPALWLATRDFAGVQIRHRATLGGNICNASPAGDTLPPLYALGATVTVTGIGGGRSLPVQEFIQGPGRVALNPGELVHSITLPESAAESTFIKIGLRQAMAIAVVSVAMAYTLKKGKFAQLSVAAGAVAPTVVFLHSVSRKLLEDSRRWEDAVELADEDIAPISDIRATADYRRLVLKNVLRYTLGKILESS